MICTSIKEVNFEKCSRMLRECRMVELRGDLCRFTTAETEELVSQHPNLLYTYRIDGQDIALAQEQYCAAIRRGARYVDVDAHAPVDFLEYIKSYAQANSCTLIISYHDFSGTPSAEDLRSILAVCRRKGADMVKIVTTAHNREEAERVMSLYGDCPEGELVAFCMGKEGQYTRHRCLELGATHTYAAYDKESATASGQYTTEELAEILREKNNI